MEDLRTTNLHYLKPIPFTKTNKTYLSKQSSTYFLVGSQMGGFRGSSTYVTEVNCHTRKNYLSRPGDHLQQSGPGPFLAPWDRTGYGLWYPTAQCCTVVLQCIEVDSCCAHCTAVHSGKTMQYSVAHKSALWFCLMQWIAV